MPLSAAAPEAPLAYFLPASGVSIEVAVPLPEWGQLSLRPHRRREADPLFHFVHLSFGEAVPIEIVAETFWSAERPLGWCPLRPWSSLYCLS